MSTVVIYTSQSGNTAKVADAIYDAIPDKDKEITTIENWNGKTDADTWFVGFWINRGTCGLDVCDLLDRLSGKRIALFATCGMHDENGYFDSIRSSCSVWVPDDAQYLGFYLCQGKMPMAVRRRYEEKKEELKERENSPDGKMSAEEAARREKELERLIANFDNALLHPDDEDLKNAADFAEKCLEKQEALDPVGSYASFRLIF
ncbi:MAG: flavodoxin family protein [Lachnospiraceae bacterium]|nr:flavodoxin family protein [Lachnospiraceae bacterium]